MTTNELLPRFSGVRSAGEEQWSAQCPAHDDQCASLSISAGDGGRTLLFCHAGCAMADVLGKIGLTPRDLFASPNGNGNGRPAEGKTKCRHATTAKTEFDSFRPDDWTDCIEALCKVFAAQLGVCVAVLERLDIGHSKIHRAWCFPMKKTDGEIIGWRLRRYDGKKLSVCGGKEGLFIPSGLDVAGKVLLVCEGPTDTAAMLDMGFHAVGRPSCTGGVKLMVELIAKQRPAAVVIAADADAPGQQGAAKLATALADAFPDLSVKIITPPPGVKDARDWKRSGATAADMQAAIDAAPPWAPPAKAAEWGPTPPDAVQMKQPAREADPGQEASAILQSTEQNGLPRLRFWRGAWMYWSGNAYADLPPTEARGAVVKHLDQSYDGLTANVTGNVMDVLKAKAMLPGLVESPAWLGERPGPWPADEVLAAKNGLVHIPSLIAGQNYITPPTPRYFSTTALNYDFLPDAPKPERWLQFLNDLWPDDPASIGALQEWMGYLLTPDTRQQKILLVVGPKRSGKGTIARTIRALIGPSNCCGPTLASLATNFGLQSLLGKSAAIISDARLGGRTDGQIVVERLLSISGEDALTIDRKFQEATTAKLSARLMIFSNELPRLGDSSGAMASRFIVLRLVNSFLGHEDHDLGMKLHAELPGILLWAIAGWQRLRERGRFVQPETGAELIDDLEDLNSPIGQFLREECIVGDDYRVARADLYDAYVKWCEAHGRKHVDDQVGFGRQLRAALPSIRDTKPRVEGRHVRHYVGVGLRAAW
jgi:putative DNA primase/helicase